MPNTKMIARYALAAGALWLVLHSAAITWRGLHDDASPADVIVVPGNKVERTGVPSVWLQDRLDKALELYQQGLAPRVIVSGGLGREGFQEAEVMRDYLVARGVPAEHVIVDNDGLDTYRTAANARRIMAEEGWSSALVVSQYYHVARVRLALTRAGIRPVYSAHAGFRLSLRQPYAILREFVAYYYYLLRPF